MSLKMPIKHSCTAECEKCEHVDTYSFDIEDIDAVYSTEREQGAETEYDYTVYVKCSNCLEDIEINGEVWEYPEGVVNLVTPEK